MEPGPTLGAGNSKMNEIEDTKPNTFAEATPRWRDRLMNRKILHGTRGGISRMCVDPVGSHSLGKTNLFLEGGEQSET